MSGLFNLPPRATRAGDSLLAKKASRAAKANAGISIKGGGGLLERISTISAMVNKNLGKYADRYDIIREEDEFEKYIDDCIEQGVISIDTETNSLDPITCTLAGLCLYTTGNKAVYIPLHHVSYVTGIEIENQVSDEFAASQMQRLVDNNVKVIMFNAKFDIRVIKNQLGVELIPHWDCYIGARLLNENEPENNLKALHKKYCLNGEGDSFTFDSLFKGIPFTHIPVNTGYLYAARDAEITYEYYEFQRPFLTENDPVCIERDLTGPAFVFNHIEMPLINIVAEMEDNGIAFDFDFADSLSKEYNAKLKEAEDKFYKECDKFGEALDNYRERKGAANKLEYPINISSPTQIAIMLYDVLEIKPVDKEKPRGTGEEILQKIDHPVAKAILEYRGVAKLLSTYIDKMPTIVNPKTGRIHASFNQMGADTGRFSSSDPNMQNIPSHNDEIRKMFRASEGQVLLSSDYSAQEPRLAAHMSQDEKMIAAYIAGKDLYVEIASIAYNLPYDECKEFREDGTRNPEGKEKRSAAKAIVLGVLYGKGVAAIAEDLRVTKKKAQEIYDKVMISFPGLKQFMEDSENMARDYGFVTTVWGRKRRLPNMQLEPYEFTYIGGVPKDFDPLFDDEDEFDDGPLEVDEATKQRYINVLNRTYSRKEKEVIKAKAKNEGILIKDNGGYIAEATRQCVNSRIQGSAADQTKLAMILVGNDKKLKELGFKLLLAVHDELIGECPRENAKEVAERFSLLMIEAAKDLVVPSKCDVEITECWYGEPLQLDE
jgi:DNA polymerase-1